MAGPCQNKGWGGEKSAPQGGGVGNGRRWDERKCRDGLKWPAPARIMGGEGKMRRKECRDGPKIAGPCQNKG